MWTRILFAAGLAGFFAPEYLPPNYPVIPAGTEVTVRLLEPVDSNSMAVGNAFQATLLNPLKGDNGETVAPVGSEATVRMVQAGSPKGEEGPQFALTIAAITIKGERYPLTSGYAEVSGGFRTSSTGNLPEGTTQTDVIVDALSSGEENAVLATAHGAGISFQLLRGPRIEVAPGVVLHFTLAQLLTVRPGNAL